MFLCFGSWAKRASSSSLTSRAEIVFWLVYITSHNEPSHNRPSFHMMEAGQWILAVAMSLLFLNMQAWPELVLDTDSHDGGRTVNLSSGHEPIGSNMATQTTEPTNKCEKKYIIASTEPVRLLVSASQQCFPLTTNQHQPSLSTQKPTNEQAVCSRWPHWRWPSQRFQVSHDAHECYRLYQDCVSVF